MHHLNATTTVESSSATSVAVVVMRSVDPGGGSASGLQRSLQRFGVIYMAIVIGLGFLGNSISCYVFVRSKLKYAFTFFCFKKTNSILLF
jgi:hypothetical protein